MTAHPPNSNATEWIKYLGAVSSLVVVVVLSPIAIWLVATTLDHSERIVSIEANRFTSTDSMRVYELLNQKADKNNVPPPVVSEAIERMERDIREIRALLEAHMNTHGGRRSSGGVRPAPVPPGEDD